MHVTDLKQHMTFQNEACSHINNYNITAGSSPSETQIRLAAGDKSLIWVYWQALFKVRGISAETGTAYMQHDTGAMKHTIV